MVSVRLAVESDLEPFLGLAREVEPLFGPMVDNPDFVEGVKGAIKNGQVICVVDKPYSQVIGACVIDSESRTILWLAVTEKSRGNGAGAMLVAAALERLGEGDPVQVTTFSEDMAESISARKLYDSFGFKEVKAGEVNPAGYATVVMERPE
ncbi:GCN5-related N-acetyltransferase [Pseudodesulfovibrio profundus]|uniref:GCN5-related N-acetyltransferase n=1 Tax=Pseudodesulfovibrio profundus TaxID=57320 RepID=A0A2C8F7F0_9BACT|nr:GNAT family N-acetyltransferase [Pseudodesulfovibrio profundus]SOB58307.1 GCN5-related N-acetyltransferase [Pseudodesulfovibrio profundus]